MKEYLCGLDIENKVCDYLVEDEIHCKGNQMCMFCGVNEIKVQKVACAERYIRTERWYEKYYRKRENDQQISRKYE